MGIGAALLMGWIGFLGGVVLFSRVGAWIVIAWEMGRAREGGARDHFSLPMAAGVSAFHSGPWFLVACAIFAYYTRGEPWWPWLFGGAIIGVLYPAGLITNVMRKRGKNAGQIVS